MAKVNAPLMSFGARGKLADTLVYFPWKGVECVRQYVKPANPNTADQQTQRGYFGDAVDDWHGIGLDAADVAAWNRAAAVEASPMSGFNSFVKAHVTISVAGLTPDMGFDGSITDSGAGQFDCSIEEGGAADAVNLIWGYSPTSLLYSEALAEAANVWTATNIAANSGAYVYGRFIIMDGGDIVGRTGIYSLKVT